MSEDGLGLLDTSVVILLDRIPARALRSNALLTTITLAELSAGPLLAAAPEERDTRQSRLQFAEVSFEAIPFDVEAAQAFGRVSASLRRAGRTAVHGLSMRLSPPWRLPTIFRCTPATRAISRVSMGSPSSRSPIPISVPAKADLKELRLPTTP